MSQESTHPPAKLTAGSRANANAIWQVMRKHWPTALATTIVAVVVTAFYTMGQKKVYEAEATVLFDPNPPRPLGGSVETVVDLGAGSFWNNQEYYETQYHIMRSRGVTLAVVHELGLNNDPAFLQDLPADEEPKSTEGTSPEMAAEILRGRVQVQPVRDSRLATVKLQDANPKRAQRLLSALVVAYVDLNLDHAVESTSSATDWLRGQLDGLKEDLETSEHRLHEYKKKNDILSIAFDDKSSMLVDQMRLLTEEMTHADSQLAQVSARYSELSSTPENDPMQIEATQLLTSPTLSRLRGDYQDAVKEYEALENGPRGENHPDVVNAHKKVETTERAVLREIHNIKKAAKRDVREVARHVGTLKADIEQAKQEAHQLNLLEIDYNSLRRSRDNTEKLYQLVLERTKEADLTQMMRVNNVSVVDLPLEPQAPIRPRVPVNIAIGLFAGVLLGVAAAFMRAMMDRTLKVPDDVEAELGLACLGLLPQLTASNQKPAYYARRRRRAQTETARGTPELIVHDEPMSSIAEAARTIRTNLMFMSPDAPTEVLLVTSAGPAEGKTTVACCIAIAMAQAGQSVALIDCDLRRPRLHRVFNKSNSVGVTTALLEGNFDDVSFETVIPDLHVTTAGPLPPNPAELFHTERFRAFLDSMRKRFDRVIIDSPPVAAVTDPTVLSTLADATVLVVRAFKTRKELARHAVRSLQGVSGNLAGVVLNAVDFSRLEYKYSHYYYYRDGYYGETPRASSPSSASEGAKQNAPPPS